MSERLKAAATQAGLSQQEQKEIDNLSKLLDTHRSLSNLPQEYAERKYSELPAEQQQGLNKLFGEEPDKPKRGWLGTAWHYSGYQVYKGLVEASDAMTRMYRFTQTVKELDDTGQDIKNIEKYGVIGGARKTLTQAWDMSNDKGEFVYNQERIRKATEKYGPSYINVAKKISEGQSVDDIFIAGTPEEKLIVSQSAQKKDPLLEEALKDVQASKYSPGRQFANALLPESMEGGGLLYNGISGTVDASYRLFADPTIILGKAKKAYDAARYGLFKIVGNQQKVDEVFQRPQVINLFNNYGKELDNLAKARKANNPAAAVEASTRLSRIAPEFGPAAIDEFVKAGVRDADTAKNYFANSADMVAIMKGQPARQTPLIPRLTASRRARINLLTKTDKFFNIDKVGRALTTAMYGATPGYEDIVTGITKRPQEIGALETGVGKFKGPDGVVRFSDNQVQGRIDRFARKFTKIPYFKDGLFNPSAADAADQVYRVSRLANSRYHSRIIKEAFQAGDENQKRQIMRGLWLTVGVARGITKSLEGKTWFDEFAAGGPAKLYAPDLVVKGKNFGSPSNFNGQQLALAPWQLSTSMAMPSVVELDRLVARSGLISRLVGVSHQRWADKVVSGWSFLTLAGPRFALRNALEDAMANLAIGTTPLGYAAGRSYSTKFRIAKGATAGKTAGQKLKETLTLDTQPFELGAINKFLRASEVEDFAKRYEDAKDLEEVRVILGQAFTRSGLGNLIDERTGKYLDELARYGGLEDMLSAVSEGAKNAVRGYDQYYTALDDAAKYGKLGPLQIDGVRYKQDHGNNAFTQINPVADQRSRVSWLVRLGISTTDEMESIAVRYLDEPQKAIDEIKKYLDNLSPKERTRFELYTPAAGGDVNIHAKRLYDSVRILYSNADGEINQKLLASVRRTNAKGEVYVTSKDLKLDTLPGIGNPKDAPAYISGPTLIPISESDNFAGSFAEKAWDAMGEANARFTREPIVKYEYGRIRADIEDSGFAKFIMDKFTAGKTGEELVKAEQAATAHLTNLAADMAKERVLAFVDNPAVRTQLAMSVRNFARFYRASEDFARRLYRIVRYNPESITRTALTVDGLSHSGFIYKDDRGEDYFVYPGMIPIYAAVQKTVDAFQMGEAFQAPMPVEFTGKVKMLAPSMNPDSLFPTFAGPLSSLPMTAVFRLFPQFDTLERALLGTYGEDQPMIDAVFPSHVLRLFATLDKNERSSQYGSASRKAMTYLEATGHGLKPKFNEQTGQWEPYSIGELEEYKRKLQVTATSILVMRFVFGFVAPASPQVTLKSEMADWARQNGRMNFKQTFNQLVAKHDSFEKAMEEWVRFFPDQMPYTVSESESNTNAIVRAVDGAADWIEKRPELFKKYPQGAAYFIPREGDFDFSAYKILFSMGIKQSKTLNDFLRDVNTARDVQFYYEQKDAYEAELAQTFAPSAKRALNDQWETWSRQFKGSNPLLQEELGTGSETALKRLAALGDLRSLVNDPSVNVDRESKQTFKRMIDVYDQYINARDAVYGGSESAQNYKDLLKVNAKAELERLSETNKNTQDAYTVLFSRLIRD